MTVSLTHQCFIHIKQAIVNGEFQPGQRLRIEQLKQRYQVGGSPVREALSRLVSIGLVSSEGKSGFKVATASEKGVRDAYRTFSQIETLALRQAMELGDESWEAGVVAALHKLASVEQSRGPVDYAVWNERNYQFHLALVQGCDSPLLLHLRDEVYWQVERYIRLSFPSEQQVLQINHEEHAQLAKLTVERKADEACNLLDYHIVGDIDNIIINLRNKHII